MVETNLEYLLELLPDSVEKMAPQRKKRTSRCKCLLADGDCELLASGILEAVHSLDIHYHRNGYAKPHQHQERYHQTRPVNIGNILKLTNSSEKIQKERPWLTYSFKSDTVIRMRAYR